MEGLRVGVTAARKADQLVELLRRTGAHVVHGPTLQPDQPHDDRGVARDTDAILDARPAWVVATTLVGMRLWLGSVDRTGRGAALRELLTTARCVARGAKATGGLALTGVRPVFTSPSETDRDVAAWLERHVVPGDAVAVQLHSRPPDPYRALARTGCGVLTVQPYSAHLPSDPAPAEALVRAVCERDVDVVTFTSTTAALNLFVIARRMDRHAELVGALGGDVAIAVVGPVTAQVFEEAGMPIAVTPRRFRTADMVRSLAAWAERRRFAGDAGVDASGLRLLPAEESVEIGDLRVGLGPREYAVLAALLRRPGVVCTVEDLHTEVWGSSGPADPSAVKHQVARLRRKLPAGSGSIATVRGRGYRFDTGAPGP